MITRSIACCILGCAVLSGLRAFADDNLTVGGYPQTLTVGPGAPTNRPNMVRPPQIPQSNPLLPPGFRPPGLPVAQPPYNASRVPPGYPAPLADPPKLAYTPPANVAPVPKPPSQPATYLAWDAESKEYSAKPGEPSAHFTFNLTNVSKEVVLINSVRTSCGCTVAQLPEQPLHLAPGTNGPINVTVNLAGKSGTIMKSVTVDSTAGVKSLLVRVNIPATPAQPAIAGVDVDRMRNMQAALSDNKAIFKGDCAKCHSEPAVAKTGPELYTAVCGICHDSAQRAAMVPDLKNLKHPTGPDHWKKWIASGKPGSMMPPFSKAEGGPLDNAQIESLVKYLSATIPSVSQSAAATTAKPVSTAPAFVNPGASKIQ